VNRAPGQHFRLCVFRRTVCFTHQVSPECVSGQMANGHSELPEQRFSRLAGVNPLLVLVRRSGALAGLIWLFTSGDGDVL